MSNGINTQTDDNGEIQIGPTSLGMVRLFFRTGKFELPMDFSPEEAEEIAAELTEAAELARQSGSKTKTQQPSSSPKKSAKKNRV
ncbi:MAG: hypothetical protein JKY63_02715 [Rhodobiaceae bacterium]|nr:hypothetical protein [Rhodobiaceae bacterium]